MTTEKSDGQDGTVDMHLEMQAEGRTVKVTCGEVVDISTVRTLHGALSEALESGAPIEIDGSSVVRVDAAGLQLLCAFVKDATTYGRKISWVGPTQAFADAARFLRVDDQLGLPESRPAESL